MTKYFSFEGLTARSEYWATVIVILICSIISGFIGGYSSSVGTMTADSALIVLGAFAMVIGLVVCVWANLALTARRCRDAGLSPWWTVVMVIPYISIIATIVFGCLPTENK